MNEITGIEKLIEAVKELVPDPPCEKFNCDYILECKHYKLACTAFTHYTNTGKAEHPSLHFINGKIVKGTVSVPSRKLYDLLHRDLTENKKGKRIKSKASKKKSKPNATV